VASGGIERLCAAADEERPLRIALIEELRRLVPFSSYVWALTDPATEVAIAPLADVPGEAMAALPRLIRLRYLTTVNRWTSLRAAAESLHRATGGQLDRSLLHREVLTDIGVGDIATVIFRDQHGFWGWLDLWREATDAPFSDRELERLSAVASPITTALRRCLALTFGQTAAVPQRPGPIVLVLSPTLEVIAQTPHTDGYLRALLPPDGDRRPVPAGAYNVAAQLLAVEAGVDDHPPTSRVRLRDGIWLTFRAARVQSDRPTADQEIAVSIEPCSPAERLDLFARTNALTPRETELLDLLMAGADTTAIAEGLYVSQHTVQDHLKSIFAKTGARTRRVLVGRVAGR
jgi:DNA-binding CsgD family transcriptional regulator